MRISDWSSDVCSSDLAGDEMPADVKLAASTDEVTECLVAVVTHVAAFVVIRHRDAGRSQPGGGIRTEHALSRHQLEANCTADEIGRAACRERVVQQWYITVVDVSLNKNLIPIYRMIVYKTYI